MRPLVMVLVSALCCGLAPGCGEGPTGGAVLVRWRIMDGVTGTNVKRCNGSPLDSHDCCGNVGGTDVTIDRLRLRTEVLHDDGSITDQSCATCCFACNPFEHTTEFELPLHTYRFSLEAYSCGVRIGHTPAPLLRVIDEIDALIDMDVQEVELYPSDAARGCAHGAVAPTCPADPVSTPVDAAASFDLSASPSDLGATVPADLAASFDLATDLASGAPAVDMPAAD